MSSFLDLAPGETNFIGSRPLTQAEADLLYFPIDGDMGSASFGVSTQEVENAIQAAIQNYQLLGKPEADQIYLSFEADFQPQIQQYQTQLNNLVDQELNLLSTSLESLVDSKLIWTEIDDKPASFPPELHTHPWENIADPPTTATRWADWNEVTGKPDFNTLYRQLGVAIDWSEISNPPAFSSDWNSITGKPSTYHPSTHGHDWSQITGVPPSSGGSVTYNIINSSPAFVEEFDDFFSLNALNKLGWNHSSQNGWGSSQPGNRFPGTSGVYALGINNSTAENNDWSHLRLGNFPIIPQLSEGYSNLEISSVIGINPDPQTEESWAARFGLLDTGAGLGTTSSILISAEYYLGGYNWVAIWRDGVNLWQKQVITPVVGDLSTKVFDLKIRIDCENYQINFSVDGTGIEVVIGQANWRFQAMSPIFYIARLNAPSPGRTFWVDKFLMRKNVSTEPLPTTEIGWADITDKPDFDLLYRRIADPVDWSDLANIPTLTSDWNSITGKPTTFTPSSHTHPWNQIISTPETATRWPTWSEVTDKPNFATLYRGVNDPIDWADIVNVPPTSGVSVTWADVSGKPTAFPPSVHEHNWEQITDRPFEQYTQLDSTGTTSRTWVGSSGEVLQWNWRTNGQHEFTVYDYNLDPMIQVARNTGAFGGYTLTNVALPVGENLAYSWGSGWSEYSPSYSARYRRLDKLVLCQGLVTRTTTTGTLIATLPWGLRPSSRRLFGCQSSQGYTRVDIDTNGQILLSTPNPSATISWISLDGISFFSV